MEWSKLKNIILIILLLLNGFLLIQVAAQRRQSAKYEEEARTGVLAVLADAGVDMPRSALPPETALPPLWCERSREAEAQMASALLGSVQRDEGRDVYQGETGEILFRSDGSFSASFSPGAWPLNGEDPGRHAQRLLEQAGYSCAVLSQQEEGGTVSVTAEERVNGVSIFDHTALLVYQDGSLLTLEGRRLSGEVQEDPGGEVLDVPTLLIRFLSGIREGGYVCRSVRSMTAGYRAEPEATGRTGLTPVWRVETDSITFYVDAVTGLVQPIS